jgi:hypothetical protein
VCKQLVARHARSLQRVYHLGAEAFQRGCGVEALEIADRALQYYFSVVAFFAVEPNVEALDVDVVELYSLFL